MTNFKELFKSAKIFPAETIYKGKRVVISDKFPVINGEILTLSIESTKSSYLQGICLGITGSCRFADKTFKKGKFMNMLLWEKSDWYDLKNATIKIYTKEPFIFINNAWRIVENGVDGPACYIEGREWILHDYWGGAAMIVEEIENGRRYYCNDGDCDDDFDDIIFTVTRKETSK